MVNKNSIDTYRRLVEPNIKKKHEKVIGALQELKEGTVYDIAEKLNKPVHSISGRLTELSSPLEYDRPVIEACGMKPNKYNNPCTLWRIKYYQEPLKQGGLFDAA